MTAREIEICKAAEAAIRANLDLLGQTGLIGNSEFIQKRHAPPSFGHHLRIAYWKHNQNLKKDKIIIFEKDYPQLQASMHFLSLVNYDEYMRDLDEIDRRFNLLFILLGVMPEKTTTPILQLNGRQK